PRHRHSIPTRRSSDLEQAANALGIPELIDARDATTDMGGRQVRELVSHLRKLSHRYSLGPTAFVATDDVVYGMARMYSILCADLDRKSTRLNSSHEWI